MVGAYYATMNQAISEKHDMEAVDEAHDAVFVYNKRCMQSCLDHVIVGTKLFVGQTRGDATINRPLDCW